jgi:DNA mismatch repair protein MutS
MLEASKHNYISAVYLYEEGGAVCFADISTGEFLSAEFKGSNAVGHIVNELVRYSPAEVILNSMAGCNPEIYNLLTKKIKCLSQTGQSFFVSEEAKIYFDKHFGSSNIDNPTITAVSGALLAYLHSTQKTELGHINALTIYTSGHYMELDWQTRRNLELTETLRFQEKRGSLLWVLDKTKTSMGGRLLRSWLEKPLLSPVLIKRRLNAVSELADSGLIRNELRELLKQVDDMERLIGRIVYGNSNSRDLAALAASSEVLPQLKLLLANMKSSMLKELSGWTSLIR